MRTKCIKSNLSKLILVFIFVLVAPVAGAVNFEGSLGEGKHTRYIPSVSNPLFNESPYITTELRPILLRNEIPADFVTAGGTIDIAALEIRVALNDRWGIIASKDGYVDMKFDAVLPDEHGAANVSLGVKYAAYSNPKTNRIVSVGVEYEAPVGHLQTGRIDLQGAGDGFIDYFVTGAMVVGKWGLQGNVGYNQALDDDHDSSMIHVSAAVNYQINDVVYPTFEINSFNVQDNGNRLPFDFEGLDLVNFGSQNAGTVTTASIGSRFIVNRHVMMGVAYETPISSRKDIMDKRYYIDMVISL